MKVKGLDEKLYNLDLRTSNKISNKSSLHEMARILIKETYSVNTAIEEVHIPGCPDNMYLDFFIPTLMIAIEVQGEQHYKFNAHFFKTKVEFLKAKRRDSDKKNWCELNSITLVELPYNEDISIWKERLLNAFGS